MTTRRCCYVTLLLVDGEGPAEGVLGLAPLDAREIVIQLLGEGADFAVVDGVIHTLDSPERRWGR